MAGEGLALPADSNLVDLAMQFLPSMNPTHGAWRSDPAGGSRLPYQAQIDDHTVLLRDGRLMQILHIGGLLFETADTEELNYRKALREAALRAMGSSQFALYQHVIRRRIDPALEGEFPDEFSAQLEAAWSDRLRRKALFRNDIYLSVIRRPRPGSSGFAERLAQAVWGGRPTPVEQLGSERRALDAAREALASALSPYGVRLLGTYARDGALYSEPLEFLTTIYNSEVRLRRLPEGDLGDHVPCRRLFFGRETVELAQDGLNPRSFAALVSVKEYPSYSSPGVLDELLRLPIELVLSQSFAFVDRQNALGRVNLALRRMRAADDEALSLRDELAEARDALASGRAAFGEHHLTVALHADDQTHLNTAVAEVQATLADMGIVGVREDLGLEPAFWAQFPGNTQFVTRRALISTRNFAGFASGHNFPIGRTVGCHWGSAVTVLETTAAGPYFFNFHQGDLGNFTIIGPSGSGKTVVLNFLLAQARRFDPKIIFFDKDRGAEPFIRAIGGRYDVLRPGQLSGLNPLSLPDTAQNRRFLLDWLSAILASNGTMLTPPELARLEDAVDANFSAPPQLRRLGHFAALLRGGARPAADDLYARLMPWWGDGERAWLFDNARDLTDSSARVVGFDMTRLLDDPVTRTPAMMYLFHRVEERLDGAPSMIVIDEGWKALDDSVFIERLKDWQKTIRKRNGLVGFVTQSAEDALKSRIASTVVEQTATQIFMVNSKAQAHDYVDGFGLTPYEFELVRTLPDSEHCFLIKHGRESVVARLNLSGADDLLTILSGREQTVRLLDEIRREKGDDPAAWMPELLRRAS